MFEKKRRKAQAPTGGQAATLVVLIALLIIFYLLFIPPNIRDQILEGTDENITSSNSKTNKTLLLDTPGTLEKIEDRDIEHLVNAVYLFATEESKILDTTPSLSVKNSVFSQKSANITFNVKDKKNVENVMLSFLAEKRTGTLYVKLNGKEVYSGQAASVNIPTIKVKPSYLVEGTNIVEFSVSPVGWSFWKTNKYQLNKIKVTADVTDVSDQLSKNIFIVSTTEKNNVERSVLRFNPDCVAGQVGKLTVYINSKSVYSAVPDCGAPAVLEFLSSTLRAGENQLVFKTDKGKYLIDLIKITSRLKKSFQPVNYFQVSETEFKDIRADKYTVNLKITFVESTTWKEGKININGVDTSLYQKDRKYTKKINDFIVKGSNSIKVIPKNRLEIVQLEVVKE